MSVGRERLGIFAVISWQKWEWLSVSRDCSQVENRHSAHSSAPRMQNSTIYFPSGCGAGSRILNAASAVTKGEPTMDQSNVPYASLDNLAVSQHEVLRPWECDMIEKRVFGLREYWTQRAERFFTLGAAAYLDAPAHRDTYLKAAKALNPILGESFSWLYERVQVGFEEVLGKPVSYDDECALPGFHIFVFHGEDQSQDRPATRAHFDMQWMHAMPDRQPEQTLSFTLLVDEPSGGSSMEIWPVHTRTLSMSFDAQKYAATSASRTLRYSRGYMVVHDGLLLHAIGRAGIAAPRGHRITFQGHGTKSSDGWKLYW